MPEKRTLERARRDRREGKSPSTQAGEFVREERWPGTDRRGTQCASERSVVRLVGVRRSADCEFRTRQELADDMNVDPQIVVGDRPEKDTRSPWVATTALT